MDVCANYSFIFTVFCRLKKSEPVLKVEIIQAFCESAGIILSLRTKVQNVSDYTAMLQQNIAFVVTD